MQIQSGSQHMEYLMNEGKVLAKHLAFNHLNHSILWKKKNGPIEKTIRLDCLKTIFKQRKAVGLPRNKVL